MIRSFRVWRDARIIRTSMPNHFEHRAGHHRWAGTNRRADGAIARRA